MRYLLFCYACLGLACASPTVAQPALQVQVALSDAQQAVFQADGRLFLFLTTSPNKTPMDGTWPGPDNFVFAQNVTDWDGQQPMRLPANSDWTRTGDWTLSNVPAGTYYAQVLWKQNSDESRLQVPGNLYSPKQEIQLTKSQTISFSLSEAFAPRSLIEHPLVREFTLQSDTLSRWWGKPMSVKAAVLLPSGFAAHPEASYPVRYNVAGYGGRYTRVNRMMQDGNEFAEWWTTEEAPQIITVFLDGEGPFGDSYQLDSENSGPYGYALIHELIPAIEREYRAVGTPAARFVDGCSTGGWVSLALQVYYPEVFNGTWSYSPDPVHFGKMQLMDVYEGKNAFWNESGYLVPSMRSTLGDPRFSVQQEINVENVQGRTNTYVTSGQQWGAWNALYSPKGKEGLPEAIFDPITGEINHTVAEHWKQYDLLYHLRDNWPELGPKLAGKLYVWMGDMDNFYLNNALRDLDAFLQTTTAPTSDAVIEFAPMEGHCSQYSHRKVLEAIAKKVSN